MNLTPQSTVTSKRVRKVSEMTIESGWVHSCDIPQKPSQVFLYRVLDADTPTAQIFLHGYLKL